MKARQNPKTPKPQNPMKNIKVCCGYLLLIQNYQLIQLLYQICHNEWTMS